jgi:hypothetical protein
MQRQIRQLLRPQFRISPYWVSPSIFMKTLTSFAILLASFCCATYAQPSAPKAAICLANQGIFANQGDPPFVCAGIGEFKNIQELYDKGFRVISSGVVNRAAIATQAFYLVIEEKK